MPTDGSMVQCSSLWLHAFGSCSAVSPFQECTRQRSKELPHSTMIDSKLISFLRKSKSVFQTFSSSNLREWKSFSSLSNESRSRFYSSFQRLIPASGAPATRSSIVLGLRALLQNNHKNFYKPPFKNFSTAASVSVKNTEGLNHLVTAGPHARKAIDWKFTSQLPPLSDDEWLIEFEKYKQSPEYKRVNKGMSVDDFKIIYWMEYAN